MNKEVTIERLIKEKREEILQVASKHGASNVRVFGSVARGEATAESDVDFLVEAGSETSAWFPAGLIIELEELLSCKVDVITDGGISLYLRDQIYSRAVSL